MNRPYETEIVTETREVAVNAIPKQRHIRPLPITLEEIDCQWLTAALRSQAPDITVKDFAIADINRGTCTKIRLQLHMDDAGKRALTVAGNACDADDLARVRRERRRRQPGAAVRIGHRHVVEHQQRRARRARSHARPRRSTQRRAATRSHRIAATPRAPRGRGAVPAGCRPDSGGGSPSPVGRHPDGRR